jgi:hypothetical protein
MQSKLVTIGRPLRNKKESDFFIIAKESVSHDKHTQHPQVHSKSIQVQLIPILHVHVKCNQYSTQSFWMIKAIKVVCQS